ncbi:MAG: N-acetylmuramoyl-L-alanine amidase, partial [Chitinophagaceae bacterium]|nr:N-acetylmuramoyl-L-alanine amidase [Chitinophagaceae bacterium]
DPGARGRYSTEAQITLAISLKLEQAMKALLPDTRIVMTRNTDIYHNVREKANIANSEGGDLFVCIHVNAASPIYHKQFLRYKTVTYYTGKGKKKKKHTRREPVYRTWTTPNLRNGTSSYVFAADRSDEKASGILSDERFESESEVVDVPDPSSPEALIKARLWSQKFFKGSVRLATIIENEFTANGRKSLGVLQRNEKGIWVLQATNMPAVLVETGFITNPDEEDYLNSEEGQLEIANAVSKSVVEYKKLVDGGKSSLAKMQLIDSGETAKTNAKNLELAAIKQAKLDNRTKELIKTINVNSTDVQVELFDNGELDGDSVSVFFNGKLIVDRLLLSTKPILLNLVLESGQSTNELVMVAENLGKIPPNTALMVVKNGTFRTELNLTSTLLQNATVRFKLTE